MKKIIIAALLALAALSALPAYSLYSPSYSYSPSVAENGDVRGLDNDGDGRRESVYVKGYYRKDGTYVRSHYRAAPSSSWF